MNIIKSICFAGAFLGLTAHLAALTVIDHGRSDFVIQASPHPVVRHAATELQHYLEAATGARLPIVDENTAGAPAFRLRFDDESNDIREHWRIAEANGDIVIAGNSPRAMLFGCYDFLENYLGVHWWTPQAESIPRVDVMMIPDRLERDVTPSFAYRDLYFDCDTGDFFARNRINGAMAQGGGRATTGGAVAFGSPAHCHTFSGYIPESEFDAHPEYFTEYQGQRIRHQAWNIGGQLCLTNPEVAAIFQNKLREHIQNDRIAAALRGVPPPYFYSITPNDSLGACECPSCAAERRQYGESGYLLRFVNTVADSVAIEFPDLRIETLAYEYYRELPREGIAPRPNTAIRICLQFNDHAHDLLHPNNARELEFLTSWSKLAPFPMVWEYGKTYSFPNDLPVADIRGFQTNYRLMKQLGIQGVFVEDESYLDGHLFPLKNWLRCKLLENTEADVEALIALFLDGYYGAAAPFLKEYLRELTAVTEDHFIGWRAGVDDYSYLDAGFLQKAHRLFDEAVAAVAGDRELLQRVNAARVSVDRATVFRRRQISFPDGMPTAEECAARAAETLARELERQPYIVKYWRDIAKADVEQLLRLSRPQPVPDEFAHFAPEKVIVLSPEEIQIKLDSHRRTEDGIHYSLPAESDYRAGAFREGAPFNLNQSFSWVETELPTEGWIHRKGLILEHRQALWIGNDWGLQIPLQLLLPPGIRQCDLYLRIKRPAAAEIVLQEVVLIHHGPAPGFAVPPEFKNISGERLIVVPPSSFSLRTEAHRYTESNTIRTPYPAEDAAIPGGVYCAEAPELNHNFLLPLPPSGETDWIKVPTVTLTPEHIVWFSKDWGVQLQLESILNEEIHRTGIFDLHFKVANRPGSTVELLQLVLVRQ